MDVDWNLIYNWLEQHSGVSYNFDDDFREITGDVAFDSPVFWSTTIGLIFDQLDEALDVIDEYGYSLPDDMPSKDQLKRIFADACITNILTNVNHIKSSLNIPIEKISSVEDLNNQVNALKDFILLAKINPVEEFVKEETFRNFEDANDDILEDKFSIHVNDLPSMWETISSIVETLKEDEIEDIEDGDEDINED